MPRCSPLRSFARLLRDGRGLVFLFVISVLLASHSIGFIRSLQRSFEATIALQRQILLGADIAVTSSAPLSTEAEKILNGFTQSAEAERDVIISFTTMARNAKSLEGRLAQIRAITKKFPLYGNVVTEPKGAFSEFRSGRGVLVEEILIQQLGLSRGESIQIGEGQFKVLGALKSIPGEIAGFALIAPRVYLLDTQLEQTKLVQFGSQIRYRHQLKTSKEASPETIQSLKKALDAFNVRVETAADREESIGKTLDRVFGFFNLTGALTLLIGGIAVGHATLLYIASKSRTLAILRALGSSAKSASQRLMIEVIALATVAALLGGFSGGLFQYLLQDLPIPEPWRSLLRSGASLKFSWVGSVEGAVLCLLATVIIALPELKRMQRLAVFQLFRSEHGSQDSLNNPSKGHKSSRSCLTLLEGTWAIYGALVLVISLSTWASTGNTLYAAGIFVGSIVIVSALLLSINALQSLSRVITKRINLFAPRYSVAALYRPHPTMRASLLVFALFGFFLCLVAFTKSSLEAELSQSQLNAQNNLVLFDIQRDQRDSVLTELIDRDVVHAAPVPIVTMRLVAVEGERVRNGAVLNRDPLREIPSWTLRREYRSTYRDYIEPSETLVAGRWPLPELENQIISDEVPISIEEGLAQKLKVGLGSKLTFDVQGAQIETVIRAIRRVNWRQIGTNFFIVFPSSVLEAAPQTFALSLSPSNSDVKLDIIRSFGKKFPNISSIDLTSILDAIDRLFQQVVRLMNFMVASIFLLSLLLFFTACYFRHQMRRREHGILRALGAAPRVYPQLVLTEYAIIGVFVATLSLLLGGGTAFILVTFILQYPFVVPLRVVIQLLFALVVFLPIAAWLITRRASKQIVVLRNE